MNILSGHIRDVACADEQNLCRVAKRKLLELNGETAVTLQLWVGLKFCDQFIDRSVLWQEENHILGDFDALGHNFVEVGVDVIEAVGLQFLVAGSAPGRANEDCVKLACFFVVCGNEPLWLEHVQKVFVSQ